MPPRRAALSRPRALARVAGLAGALALLAACGGGATSGERPPTEVLELEPTAAATSAPTTSPPVTPPPDAPTVVSLGDSFISGEAGRWAGNTASSSTAVDALGPSAYLDSPDGASEVIPLCHRSTSAMVHIGDDGPPAGGGNAVASANLACSGAETRTFTESGGAFKPGLDFVGQGTAQQGQAALLQEFAEGRDVRMVLVSIGGNDFGFADVITTCAEDFVEDGDYCKDDPTVSDRASKANVATIAGRITTALQDVREAMRNAGHEDGSWTLVMNLNPDTLPLGGDFRYPETEARWTDGGCGVYDVDATWAGTTFVGAVREAQAQAVQASGVEPAVLLDLGPVLDQRELCATGTALVASSGAPATWQDAGAVDQSEWAQQIRSEDDAPYFEQESLHPDYWAQLAMRSCVRQLYAAAERADSTCSRSGTGLTARGEPMMTLAPSGS